MISGPVFVDNLRCGRFTATGPLSPLSPPPRDGTLCAPLRARLASAREFSTRTDDSKHAGA